MVPRRDWRRLEEAGGVWILAEAGCWRRMEEVEVRGRGEVKGHSLCFCPEVGARHAAP